MASLLRLGLLLWLAAGLAAAEPPSPALSYWVWHRSEALRPEEIAGLQAQGVKTLFWNVGELQLRDGAWRWNAAPRAAADLGAPFQVVPVVRMTAIHKAPLATARAVLLDQLAAAANPAGELQIDFDCPDRLLGAYAAFLTELRARVPQLSITALARWSERPEFGELQRSVAGIAPMFYDLQADPTGVGAFNLPPPLLDPEQTGAALKRWSRCAIPWRAGLPSFARLTVFEAGGNSRGQIANWRWEDVCFQPGLRAAGTPRLGVTLLRADRDLRVAGTALREGEFLAARVTDRAALAQLCAQALQAGAVGVTLFRLPDGTAAAGPTLRDLGRLGSADAPRLVLRWSGPNQLELANVGAVDLAPRLGGQKDDRDRGYALELDAPGALFREAEAGQFWRVAAHSDPDTSKPKPAPVALATRLTFWFSDLPAGARRQSGLLQLSPGASLAGLRYRILNCSGADQWTALDPP